MVISLWMCDSEGLLASVLGSGRDLPCYQPAHACAQLHRLRGRSRLPGNVLPFRKRAMAFLMFVEDERCVVREAKLVPVSLGKLARVVAWLCRWCPRSCLPTLPLSEGCGN